MVFKEIADRHLGGPTDPQMAILVATQPLHTN